MISDTERREIAQKLRAEALAWSESYPGTRLDMDEVEAIFYELVRFAGISGVTYPELIYARFADLIEPCPIDGETSDGYHTFNELYHHRAVLFSVIVATFGERAWKSKLHADGTMYDGMFIVGIETPDGQATYHYDIDPYWNLFRCTELERAPEWDGHTPNQAIERIGKLADMKTTVLDLTEVTRTVHGEEVRGWECRECGQSCRGDGPAPTNTARIAGERWFEMAISDTERREVAARLRGA